ncbi:MAG TPA: prenyltransferase/squalene oxidase repeat-containing protein [Actinospica sp.]|nr:prenyltransferase/squalene oxidase repeat-containing protein [Actinospica sp.]
MNEGSTESLAAAWEYVHVHGDLLDRARFAALAHRPVEGGPIPPGAPQNPDGGWPAFWSAGLSTLDGTCYQLFLLRGLPAEAIAADIPAALAFITRAQAADGTWSEGPSPGTPQFEIPQWLLPGSPGARAYLTANCAATLADYDAAPDEVAKASDVLEWLVDPHGRLPAPLVAHWLAARVLRTQQRIMVVRRLLDVVGRSFENFDASDLAWFGACTRPGDRWNRRIAARLMGLQNPDGSWSDAAGEQPGATLTVSAAAVLLAAEQSGPVRYPAMQELPDFEDDEQD